MSAAADKILDGLEQAVAHSKGPQFTAELEMRVSSLPSANNSFHLYLADKRGRKVAALWGGANEKMANGYLWSAAPDLYAELQQFVNGVETRMIDSPADETLANITHRAKAALAKARGEQVLP